MSTSYDGTIVFKITADTVFRWGEIQKMLLVYKEDLWVYESMAA